MTRAAILVSTQGQGFEATLEIEGHRICVMDDFSAYGKPSPASGDMLQIELYPSLLGDEEWEEIFAGNPHHRVGLKQIAGWKYRVYGCITELAPVRINCGLVQFVDVLHTSDSRVLGEYVAFTIERLDALLNTAGYQAHEAANAKGVVRLCVA